MVNYLRYANQGATRNQPLDPSLVNALAFLGDMGVTAEVFSGGQPAKGSGGARVGSVRHDHGHAGDMRFYKDGRPISWSNPNDLPIFQDIVKRGKAAGITGFGAGPGYMGEGTMHVGFGSPGVWGAGGSGANAPDWLRAAYGMAPTNPNEALGGDGMVARNHASQVAGQTNSPLGILGQTPFGQQVAQDFPNEQQWVDPNDLKKKEGGILAGLAKGLMEMDDASHARMGPMGDARQSGMDLLKYLGNGGIRGILG